MELPRKPVELDAIHSSVGLFLLAGLGRMVVGLGFMPKNTLTPQGRPVNQDILPAVRAADDAAVIRAFEASFSGGQ